MNEKPGYVVFKVHRTYRQGNGFLLRISDDVEITRPPQTDTEQQAEDREDGERCARHQRFRLSSSIAKRIKPNANRPMTAIKDHGVPGDFGMKVNSAMSESIGHSSSADSVPHSGHGSFEP